MVEIRFNFYKNYKFFFKKNKMNLNNFMFAVKKKNKFFIFNFNFFFKKNKINLKNFIFEIKKKNKFVIFDLSFFDYVCHILYECKNIGYFIVFENINQIL